MQVAIICQEPILTALNIALTRSDHTVISIEETTPETVVSALTKQLPDFLIVGACASDLLLLEAIRANPEVARIEAIVIRPECEADDPFRYYGLGFTNTVTTSELDELLALVDRHEQASGRRFDSPNWMKRTVF